jgi:hypothetical protein
MKLTHTKCFSFPFRLYTAVPRQARLRIFLLQDAERASEVINKLSSSPNLVTGAAILGTGLVAAISQGL